MQLQMGGQISDVGCIRLRPHLEHIPETTEEKNGLANTEKHLQTDKIRPTFIMSDCIGEGEIKLIQF